MHALDRILAEIGRGEVVFPTHADVALRVRLALDDPDIPLAEATRLVQAEPYLAARVVAIANSVLFRRGRAEVADVRSGIVRLGLRFVRSLATAVVMRQMAHGIHEPQLRAMAGRLWEHAAHVAALAHVLAKRYAPALAETALFAGMVHEAGGFYLIARAEDHADVFTDGSLGRPDAQARIGQAVLGALGVPAEVVAGIEALWTRAEDLFPPATLGDLLRLAHRLTPIRSPLEAEAGETGMPADPVVAGQVAEVLEASAEALAGLSAALHY